MSRTVLGFSLTQKFPPPARKKRRKSNTSASGRPPVYPFSEMKVGESFFVPNAESGRVSSAAAYHRSMKFVTRAETYRNADGVRVWRVK